jgi:hypothetical protein
MNKIEYLKTMIENESTDPFLYYCLALEYIKINHKDTLQTLDILLQKFPQYLPTYFHAAQYYQTIDAPKAIEIYNNGILLAQKENNFKTLAELKNALLNFELEID